MDKDEDMYASGWWRYMKMLEQDDVGAQYIVVSLSQRRVPEVVERRFLRRHLWVAIPNVVRVRLGDDRAVAEFENHRAVARGEQGGNAAPAAAGEEESRKSTEYTRKCQSPSVGRG